MNTPPKPHKMFWQFSPFEKREVQSMFIYHYIKNKKDYTKEGRYNLIKLGKKLGVTFDIQKNAFFWYKKNG